MDTFDDDDIGIEFFDPYRNRIDDLVKLSKAHDESLSPEFKEVLLDAAKLTMAELVDYCCQDQQTAELHAFPGGKH